MHSPSGFLMARASGANSRRRLVSLDRVLPDLLGVDVFPNLEATVAQAGECGVKQIPTDKSPAAVDADRVDAVLVGVVDGVDGGEDVGEQAVVRFVVFDAG